MAVRQRVKSSLKWLQVTSLLRAERWRTGAMYAPVGDEYWSDPYPMYARLRERDPFHRSLVTKSWIVTRYADVDAVLRDERFLVDGRKRVSYQRSLDERARAGLQDADLQNPPSMLMLDPPDHTRMRGLVSKAFTPRRVAELRPRIEAIVGELLDRVAGAGGMDVIRDFAYPLPVTVIAELLGIPSEHHDSFKRWSDAIVRSIGYATLEELRAAHDAQLELRAFLEQVATEQRDGSSGGLLGALLTAEEEGDKLSLDEVYSTCAFLLIAGHETTTNLIGNGLLALLQHPDQLELLRSDPSLTESAVEELLRYDGPISATARFPLEEAQVGRWTVRPGEQVALIFSAANRDPERFPDPDRLDITRQDNRHFAFGQGIHHCLGAPLARLEGQIAFAALAERFPRMRLAAERPQWGTHMFLRGLRELPVTF